MRTPPLDRKQVSTTLIKGLDVLTLLSSTREGLTLVETVRALHEARSNVLRLLRTLELYGLVEQSERTWRVSPGFASWAMGDRRHALCLRYRPILERIAGDTGELVLLGLHEANGVVHLDYIESDHAVRVAPAPLTRHNLRVNALGKLALSRRPDLARKIEDPRLLEELTKIRKNGVAWNREESVQGMIALAHPGLIDAPTEPMIAVAWPSSRFTESKGRAAIRAIRRALAQGSK